MGTTCNPALASGSSLEQGTQFATMTRPFHGGSRKSYRKSKNMRTSRKTSRKSRKNRTSRKMKGGAYFASFADYPTSFSQMLPTEIRDLARVAPLDAKFAELPAIERAAGVPMMGGSRKSRRGSRKNKRSSRKHSGGSAPVSASPMILTTPEELAAARLNPQWYTENTVIPNFRGDIPFPGGTVPAPSLPPMPTVGGRRRKSRRNGRK